MLLFRRGAHELTTQAQDQQHQRRRVDGDDDDSGGVHMSLP